MTGDGLLRIEGWARDGLNDEQIAKNIGIHVATLYRWQNSFGEIREAIKKGKAPVDYEIENALFKRACGFDYEETITDIEELPDGKQKKHVRKVKKHCPPDTLALIFWLKNRRPERWRDKPAEVEDHTTMQKLDKLLEVAWNAAHTETS